MVSGGISSRLVSIEEGRDVQRIQRALRMLDSELPKRIRAAGKEAAEPVAVEARRRVPVDSGRLKRSIRVTSTSRGVGVRAGNSRVPYAAVIEFGGTIRKRGAEVYTFGRGARRRTIFGIGRSGTRRSRSIALGQTSRIRVEAQPYLFPAAEDPATLKRVRDEYWEAVTDLMERVGLEIAT